MRRFIVQAGLCCDQGEYRSENQDNFLVDGRYMALHERSAGANILLNSRELYQYYAVCDGMGGESAGEVAAFAAVQFLAEALQPGTVKNQQSLLEMLYQCNRAVCEANPEPSTTSGTTLALCCLTPQGLHIAHIGDSRVYLRSADGLQRLTADHSRAQWLRSHQDVKPEQIAQQDEHVLTRYLGRPEQQGIRISPEIVMRRTLQAGDRLLLCTDGVHGSLPEDELQEALNNEDCLAAAQALVGAARKQGSTDNATALVIQIEHIQGGLRALLSL